MGGASSPSSCTRCPRGTWSNQVKAVSAGTCTDCGVGKWGIALGAEEASQCIDCSPGAWNDQTGAGSQTACRKCPKGTWSEQRGAGSDSTCVACAPGKYQPADGQANRTHCLPCSPGSYSTVPGASACSHCPGGTWSDGFDATACNVCPEGKWTFSSVGAREQGDCTLCMTAGCLQDASARVTVEVVNFALSALSAEEQMELSTECARDIALTCGVSDRSVVDAHDGTNSSVSIGEDGTISAYILSIADGSSANILAAKLYSSAFRDLLQNTILRTVGNQPVGAGSGRQVMVGAVTFQPEAFVPSDTSTSTSSSTMHTTGGRSDFVWFCVVLGCVAFPGTVAVVVLLLKEAWRSSESSGPYV